MRKVPLYGTLVVALVTLANLTHGGSHDAQRVPLAAWQWVFVLGVIFSAPLVAAVLLWTRLRIAGAWLLLASMVASLVFGLAYHFLVPGPDNVFTNGSGTAFAATSVLVALSQAFGAGVGVWAVGRFSRVPFRTRGAAATWYGERR